jgi:A/G-specific adenine glycosylase
MTAGSGGFATAVIAWQKHSGRHALPWQASRDPYRVWLSEIMLQQTQVSTVRDYYPRFLARFPDVQSLAAASLDDVLGLWSGLGYYSRARNLHRCAQAVVADHGGCFPATAALLQTLPGIGRSTAAAVAAFCQGERVAILDGNVRRVLTRLLAFDADLSLGASQRALWDRATALLPASPRGDDMARYTQGLMDLGSGVCTTRRPQCLICPAGAMCLARQQGDPERFPVKSRKLRRSAQALWLLCALRADGAVWLSRRPTPGVWAGLYCPPLFDSFEALQAALAQPLHGQLQEQPSFVHVLTHKDLHLHPVSLNVAPGTHLGGEGEWVGAQRWPGLGLPAPVRKLLAQKPDDSN